MATFPILRGTVIALVITLILWFFQEHSPTAHASGIVGNGTPQSCTSQALVDAMSGGLVTFNCGAAPETIIITATGGADHRWHQRHD